MYPNHTTNEIPHGYCQCGCGQKTKPATITNRKRGAIKGVPQRYIAGHYKNGGSPRNTIVNFWERVQVAGPDDCWLWTALCEPAGYGVIKWGGVTKKTHRLSWEIHFGEIPDRLFVCHRCDVRNCVNPHHLFLGTMADNIHDMYNKGRDNHPGMQGEAHPLAKLTEEQVKLIRQRVTKRGQRKAIAEEYGVSVRTIDSIITGKTWKHIT